MKLTKSIHINLAILKIIEATGLWFIPLYLGRLSDYLYYYHQALWPFASICDNILCTWLRGILVILGLFGLFCIIVSVCIILYRIFNLNKDWALKLKG